MCASVCVGNVYVSYVTWTVSVPDKNHRLINIFIPGIKTAALEILFTVVLVTLKIIQIVDIAFNYFSRIECAPLLMKKTHTYDI